MPIPPLKLLDRCYNLAGLGVLSRDELIEAGTDYRYDHDDYDDDHYFRYVFHLNPPRYSRVELGPSGRHVFDVLLISKGNGV